MPLALEGGGGNIQHCFAPAGQLEYQPAVVCINSYTTCKIHETTKFQSMGSVRNYRLVIDPQTGVILPTRVYLTMSIDIFDFCKWKGATGT